MSAYYNEIDPKAAAWLRELIKQGHIAQGEVDERSIEDVKPDDVKGFCQAHWFAGIGVWSYALRRAGYPDDMHVWTGSCPCQPFSAAGKGGGFSDERHLWPAFFHLIESCRPVLVMGEQVASKDGLAWLDLVQTDLEGTGYAFGALDTCAAGVGAPHIRQRLYWLADANNQRLQSTRNGAGSGNTGRASQINELANTEGARLQMRNKAAGGNYRNGFNESSDVNGMEHSDLSGCERRTRGGKQPLYNECEGQIPDDAPGPTNGFWRNADWLFCRDGKWRAVEPGTFPLVNGTPARVGRLRGYGNAINAEQATENIKALMEVLGI